MFTQYIKQQQQQLQSDDILYRSDDIIVLYNHQILVNISYNFLNS